MAIVETTVPKRRVIDGILLPEWTPPAPKARATPGRIPNHCVFVACLLLSVSAICSYWWVAWRAGLSEIDAMTSRYSEAGYLTFNRTAGELNFTDTSIYEHDGRWMHGFPLLQFLPHGIAYRLLGAFGVAVVDCLVMACYFLGLRALLREAGVGTNLASIASALAGSLLLSPVSAWISSCLGVTIHLPFWAHYWSPYRPPRPFLSDPVLFVATWWMIRCFLRGDNRRFAWIALGVSIGLISQFNIYNAPMVAILLAVGITYRLSRRETKAPVVSRAVLSCLIAAVVLVPFAIQQSLVHPDVAARYGVAATPRFGIWFRPTGLPDLAIASVAGVLAITFDRRHWKAVIVALSIVVASSLAMPLQVAVLGKAVQVAKYFFEPHRMAGYAILLFGVLCVQRVTVVVRGRMPRKYFAVAAIVVMLAFSACVLRGVASNIQAHRNWIAGRSIHAGPPFASDRYRSDRTELFAELSKPLHSLQAVLGTFDLDLSSMWSTQFGHHIYVPDAFFSPVPDEVLESRFAEFCRESGVTQESVSALLASPYIAYTLGHRRYAVVNDSAWLKDFSLTRFPASEFVIPECDKDRIRKRIGSATGLSGRLDLIVLTNDDVFGGCTPDLSVWDLQFSNKTFRVYSRSARQPTAHAAVEDDLVPSGSQ